MYGTKELKKQTKKYIRRELHFFIVFIIRSQRQPPLSIFTLPWVDAFQQ